MRSLYKRPSLPTPRSTTLYTMTCITLCVVFEHLVEKQPMQNSWPLGFFGLRAGQIVGIVSLVITAPFAFGILRDYETLSASLLAYPVSTQDRKSTRLNSSH